VASMTPPVLSRAGKIVFILHLLVFLTFTSFFLPADEFGTTQRIAISSTMFLALTGLMYVATDTLPRLEYLTNCDILIVVSSLLVFAVNICELTTERWRQCPAAVCLSDKACHRVQGIVCW
jgi:hypothetical protein